MRWNESQAQEIAAGVLSACRSFQPTFPRPDAAMLQAWAAALAAKAYPRDAYAEAVASYYRADTKGVTPTPGAILHHVKVVLAEWESDPRRRGELRKYRQFLRDEQDRQIKDGSFWRLRGFEPARALPAGSDRGEPNAAAYEQALDRDCRACGVGVGQWCVDGDGDALRRPHFVRVLRGRSTQ